MSGRTGADEPPDTRLVEVDAGGCQLVDDMRLITRGGVVE